MEGPVNKGGKYYGMGGTGKILPATVFKNVE